MAESDAQPGRVILAGVPLGQPGDASARLRAALADTAVIAAEDTRRLRRLCADLGVRPSGRVVSYFEANELARLPLLLELLRSGQDVLVVTDAGMPSVSDPGYRLVAAAVEAGVPVTALPGPSAVTTALAVSGLAVDRFCFEGFLPRRAGERRRRLAELAAEPRTMVFFEAPHRLAAALADLATAFGADRRAVVCRELTKTYEQVLRDSLGELAEWARGEVRGEITLVIEGAPGRGPAGRADAAGSAASGAGVNGVDAAALAAEVARREQAGEARKQAITAVAREHGLAKRVVFDAVVAAKT